MSPCSHHTLSHAHTTTLSLSLSPSHSPSPSSPLHPRLFLPLLPFHFCFLTLSLARLLSPAVALFHSLVHAFFFTRTHTTLQDLEAKLAEFKNQAKRDSVDLTRLQTGVDLRNNQAKHTRAHTLSHTHTHIHTHNHIYTHSHTRTHTHTHTQAHPNTHRSDKIYAHAYSLSFSLPLPLLPSPLSLFSLSLSLTHTHTAACHSGRLCKRGHCS